MSNHIQQYLEYTYAFVQMSREEVITYHLLRHDGGTISNYRSESQYLITLDEYMAISSQFSELILTSKVKELI